MRTVHILISERHIREVFLALVSHHRATEILGIVGIDTGLQVMFEDKRTRFGFIKVHEKIMRAWVMFFIVNEPDTNFLLAVCEIAEFSILTVMQVIRIMDAKFLLETGDMVQLLDLIVTELAAVHISTVNRVFTREDAIDLILRSTTIECTVIERTFAFIMVFVFAFRARLGLKR